MVLRLEVESGAPRKSIKMQTLSPTWTALRNTDLREVPSCSGVFMALILVPNIYIKLKNKEKLLSQESKNDHS